MKHYLASAVLFVTALFCSCTKITDSEKVGTGETFSNSLSASTDGSSSGGGNSGGGGTAGVITAGEWNDLENWNFWKSLLQKDTLKDIPATWGLYTKNTVTVILKDRNNKLLSDAKITLDYNTKTASAKTDNFGKAVLIAGLTEKNFSLSNFSLEAEYLGKTYSLGSFIHSENTITKTIAVTKTSSGTLDILFAVDATGSMGDEITFLKTELTDVINRSGSQLPGTKINMGTVFYRDREDDYLTRPFGFTNSTNSLVNFIKNQEAGGGGDFPEAVDEALKACTENMQWSNTAINRLLFLVLDAPPHKVPADLDRLYEAIKTAQEKGIRIIPISASGIDQETEFLLRSMAISTNSTYVFITNDSGIGNPHLTPTVGTYKVEFLNDLIVRLITKYGKNHD